jgi:hypothetical protein
VCTERKERERGYLRKRERGEEKRERERERERGNKSQTLIGPNWSILNEG